MIDAKDQRSHRQAQAKNADVVLLIGEREGPRQAAWAAKKHGVPIVPIPILAARPNRFGKSGARPWPRRAAFEECEALARLYDKFNAEQIVDLALRLAHAHAAGAGSRQQSSGR